MPNELPQLSRSDELLARKNESPALLQFIQSVVYSAAESPIRALAQIVDSTGSKTDDSVKSAFKHIGVEQPKPAVFGSTSWVAQSLGSAVGMAVPFLAIRGAVSSVAEQKLSAKFLGSPETLSGIARREAILSGGSGLLYGAVFSPSKESNVGSAAFIGDRLKNGLGDMATFAALGYASPYMAKGFDSLASYADSLSPQLARALRSPVSSGIASGIPGGLVSAEVGALKDGRILPTSTEVKQSVLAMAFVGGTFGAAAEIAARLNSVEPSKSSSESSPLQKTQKSETAAVTAVEQNSILSMTEARQRIETAIAKGQQPDPRDIQASISQVSDPVAAFAAFAAESKNSSPQNTDSAKDAISAASDRIKATDKTELPGFEIVLGASGVEAPAHIGFLKALEDRNVPIDKITRVSGGSLVAALYANGYKTKQLSQILLSSDFRSPSFDILAKCFHMQDPWNLLPYAIDFRPWLQNFVDKYDLKPQDNLRIVAADAKTSAPVVFEGRNYDLVEALAASTAATPALRMKPVMYKGRELVDGFYYHPIPADLTKAPALVSKIGFVKQLPGELLAPWDYFMHLREMSLNSFFEGRYPDPPGHIIAETGLPNVSTTTFGVSLETLKKLIVHAEDSTNARLNQPDAQALLNARKPK